MKTISEMISDRFRNGFVANFSIAWAFKQWKLIIILTSTSYSDPNAKFSAVESYMRTPSGDIWHMVWQPLALSLIAMFFLPVLKVLSRYVAAWFDDMSNTFWNHGARTYFMKSKVRKKFTDEYMNDSLNFMRTNITEMNDKQYTNINDLIQQLHRAKFSAANRATLQGSLVNSSRALQNPE